MKPDTYFEPFAEAAFSACEVEHRRQDKSWPVLTWRGRGAAEQSRWIAAVKAVFRDLRVRDENDEHYVE